MMADPVGANQVLSDILGVLQGIEAKLDGHEERFRNLEGNTRRTAQHEGSVNQEADTLRAAELSRFSLEAQISSRKGTSTNDDTADDTKTPLKVPYSQWSINQVDRFFDLALSNSLAERLRDCWGMPDDNRLPLKFFKSDILKTNAPWGAPCDSYPTIRQPVKRDLEFLCQFDETLRTQAGNDFVVIDFDVADNTRIYRLGNDAIGSELEVEAQYSKNAPWSRLMYVN